MSGPERELGEMLLRIGAELESMFAVVAKAESLTPAEARLLRLLADTIPQAELAPRLGVDKARVSSLIRRLEARSLVRRDHDPGDRRARHVGLTLEGRQTIDRLGEGLQRASPVVQRLTVKQRRELIDHLLPLDPLGAHGP
ncbi:MAG: MarR family transcriptional regulator [Actinomycetota bacterium]